MIKKIIIFFKNWRRKRLIRLHIREKYKQYKPINNILRSYPPNRTQKRRIDDLTESIFKASRIVEREINEERELIEGKTQELLLDKLKNVIDQHYNEIEKENNKLKSEISKLDSKLKTERKRNTQIKELIK